MIFVLNESFAKETLVSEKKIYVWYIGVARGESVNPIQSKGADYAYHNTAIPPSPSD